CTSAWDVLTGAVPVGQEVIVYDGTGRHPAPLVAEMAVRHGGHVSFASIDGMLAQELTYSERTIWKREFYNLSLTGLFDQRLKRVERAKNRLAATLVNVTTGQETVWSGDQVVVEHGTQPADELFHSLRAHSGNDGVTNLDALVSLQPQNRMNGGFELHRVGDAVASRNIAASVFDSLRLCYVI
ncbi:MAG: N-methylproline demethylase, partial [Acetobacteraceae bacterium]|nr:N-methylproline demethylase [Acetobacteraceae bacterium]